jgi:hypothetical protein
MIGKKRANVRLELSVYTARHDERERLLQPDLACYIGYCPDALRARRDQRTRKYAVEAFQPPLAKEADLGQMR